MDNRGVSPVVEKLLTAALVLLFVGGLTSTLFGGAVPAYRSAAGAEVSERVLATAAHEVETAPPSTTGNVTVERRVSLPATIRTEGYALVLANGTLRLEHPHGGMQQSTRLSLPRNVSTVESRWESGSDLLVRVEGDAEHRRIALVEAD